MYLRQQDGTPYYVGKGCGNRAFGFHRAGLCPPEHARIFIQYWLDEKTAFDMEKFYIRLFGRKDLGTGILRNLSDGGESVPFDVCSKGGRRNVENGNLAKIAVMGGRSVGRRNVENGHLKALLAENIENGHFARISVLGGRAKLGRPSVGSGNRNIIQESRLRGLHTRWHVNRGLVKPDCESCSALKI